MSDIGRDRQDAAGARHGRGSGSKLAMGVERRVRRRRRVVGVLVLLTTRLVWRRFGVRGAGGADPDAFVDGDEGKRAEAAIEGLDAIALLAAVGFGVWAATAPRAEVAITAAVTVLGHGSTGVGSASARGGSTLATGGGTRSSGPVGTGGRGGASVGGVRFIVALARAKGCRSGVVGVGEMVLENKIGVGLADLGQI